MANPLHLQGRDMQVNKGLNGRYSVEFRLWAVEQLRSGVSVENLARQTGVHRTRLYRWKKNPIHPDSKRNLPPAEESPRELRSPQGELEQVKQALAEKVLELDFLKGALQRIEARRQRSASSGETTSTEKSRS